MWRSSAGVERLKPAAQFCFVAVEDDENAATEMILADILPRRRASLEHARPGRAETEAWQEFFEPDFLADMLPTVWALKRDARDRRDIFGTVEHGRRVPTGAIEQQNGLRALGDLT